MLPHMLHEFLHAGEGTTAASRGAEEHLTWREETDIYLMTGVHSDKIQNDYLSDKNQASSSI